MSPHVKRERRAHARYRVLAEAVWSAGREEGRCRIRTLSWGGAGISEVGAPLRVGERLRVTLLSSDGVSTDGRLGTAEVEVVRSAGDRLGLRFLRLDADLERELEELFALLTPLEK